jgi:hypothetical protein
MRNYVRTITFVVQVGFLVAGIGFFALLLPELSRFYGERDWTQFRGKLFAGAFALAVCMFGVTGAALTRRFLLRR